MNQGQNTLNQANSPQSNKKSRVLKLELGSYNTIAAYALQVLKKSPKTQNSSSKQKRSQEYFASEVLLPNKEDFLPPSYNSKRNKTNQANKVQKIKEERVIQVKEKAKSRMAIAGKKTLRNSREIDLHFSLSRLAFLVKLHIERNHITMIDRIYYDIFGKYLENFPKKTVQAQQVMIRVKRRLLQVLKVFYGSEIINFQMKQVVITEFGKLKGSRLCELLKRKKEQQYKKQKKQLDQKIEYRDNLKMMITQYQRILARNTLLLKDEQKQSKKRQILGSHEKNFKFDCPFLIFSSPPVNNLKLFKNPKVDLIESVQCKKNRILIKGENLKIYSFGDALFLMAKLNSATE